MDCKKIELRLSLYIDGQLPENELNDFEQHIHKCNKCAKLLEETRSAIKIVSNVPEQPLPGGIYERLNRRLYSEKRRVPAIGYGFNWNHLTRGIAAVTVLILALFCTKEMMIRKTERFEPVIVRETKQESEKEEIIRKEKITRKEKVVEVKKKKPETKKIEQEKIVPPVVAKEEQITEIFPVAPKEEKYHQEIVEEQITETSQDRKETSIFVGYSKGIGYNSNIFSVYYRNPAFINLGIDGLLLNWNGTRTPSSGYVSFLYAGSKLFQRKILTADWFAGIAMAQRKSSAFSSDLATTVGAGITCNYIISSKFSIDSKVVGIFYSNSFSFPYQIGLAYAYKKLIASVGIQGVLSLVAGSGGIGLENDAGNMLVLKYGF